MTYCFVLFEALHPSQQFLVMSGCFPGLKMKSLAQGHNTVPLVRFEPTVTLRLRDPHSNQMSKLKILPISWVNQGYVFEGGEGANALPLFYRRGANVHHYTFVDGTNVLPCQSLRGQMSLYTIFHRGADVRGGKCPAPEVKQ